MREPPSAAQNFATAASRSAGRPSDSFHAARQVVQRIAATSRAIELGWRREQVSTFDEDLGISADGIAQRSGFAHMASEVALGRVGIVFGIEVSRLARNNADWYRLLDLCGVTDTLVADSDGIYHPTLFNDRLVLGLKGTMAEAELHILRARLNGGIRNKAARGELRRGLPVGLVWGEMDGEVLFHPDEAVTGAIRTVFERFAEMGSARQVWLWFRSQGLLFPLQTNALAEIRWVTATYTAIHQVLTSPVYAGAYVYGRTRQERYVDDQGHVRKRLRRLPRDQWAVLVEDLFLDRVVRRRPAPRRIRDACRTQSVHVPRVVSQSLDVLEPRTVGQHVVREIQDVVRLEARAVPHEDLNALVDRPRQPHVPDQLFHQTDSALRDRPPPVRHLVSDVLSAPHRT
jgi:DNA invertase Pin-like site-specific DNA recombinase